MNNKNDKMTKNLKQLPIGRYSFQKIIENNYLYIDKTDLLHDIISNYQYVFLSRPRRFGKSLVLSTLENIFKAKKDLFKGLKIEKLYDFKEEYPVITISQEDVLNDNTLKATLLNNLKINAKNLGITDIKDNNPSIYFQNLIIKAYEKYNKPVVVLIDEYDKPILSCITNDKLRRQTQDELKAFYSVLKNSDRYLKFVFLTGVTKFSKISVFSGLNNIEDISLSPKYATVCGYTQNEIETTLKPYLGAEDLEKLKRWYNVYNFLGDTVYNPYGIFLFIRNNKVFSNYWSSTGIPTFLVKLIQKKRYNLIDFENIVLESPYLDSFDVDNIDIRVLLYQAGYLTIKEVRETLIGTAKYKLYFPNIEVKQSFTSHLLTYFLDYTYNSLKDTISEAILKGDLNLMETNLRNLFDSIAYNNFTKNDIAKYEGFYASVIYAYFMSLGIEMIAEDSTSKGRIDLTLKYQNKVYIFEFKVNSKESAIKQIYDREYFKK